MLSTGRFLEFLLDHQEEGRPVRGSSMGLPRFYSNSPGQVPMRAQAQGESPQSPPNSRQNRRINASKYLCLQREAAISRSAVNRRVVGSSPT